MIIQPFLLTLLYLSCASSKHLQTRRFLDTLQGYLLDIQRMLIQLHRSANQRPAPFVDHSGILRDSKTGRPINGATSDSSEEEEDAFVMRMLGLCFLIDADLNYFLTAGYSFFDSGEVALLGRKKKSPFSNIGVLALSNISSFFSSWLCRQSYSSCGVLNSSFRV